MSPSGDDHTLPGVLPDVAAAAVRVARCRSDVRTRDALAGGEVPDPEDERLEPRRGRGDRVHIEEGLRLLDQHLDADRTDLDPRSALQVGQQIVDEPHVAGGHHLGQDDQVQVPTSAADHLVEVVVEPVRADRVDAAGADLASPVELAEPGDDVGSGRGLRRHGDGVLEVEEDQVRLTRGGLCDHLGTRGRNGQLGTSQPLGLLDHHTPQRSLGTAVVVMGRGARRCRDRTR
nr:hypothetical protein [Nocardioides humi]